MGTKLFSTMAYVCRALILEKLQFWQRGRELGAAGLHWKPGGVGCSVRCLPALESGRPVTPTQRTLRDHPSCRVHRALAEAFQGPCHNPQLLLSSHGPHLQVLVLRAPQ